MENLKGKHIRVVRTFFVQGGSSAGGWDDRHEFTGRVIDECRNADAIMFQHDNPKIGGYTGLFIGSNRYQRNEVTVLQDD